MTDIAGILACYRSGQISEDAMVDICREWPEVEEALKATSITDAPRFEAVEAGGCAPPIIASMTHEQRVQEAIDAFNARGETEEFYGKQVRIYARRPILATDCDYEIVTVSGVQGRRVR